MSRRRRVPITRGALLLWLVAAVIGTALWLFDPRMNSNGGGDATSPPSAPPARVEFDVVDTR